MKVKEWVWKEQRKHHRCQCGCGQFIVITTEHHKPSHIIPKYIKGHYGLKDGKSFVNEFIKQEQGKHFCQCGCGGEIIIQARHNYEGIPKVIFGHIKEESREKMIKAHIGQKPSKETQKKLSKIRWKGGKRVANRRSKSKRRNLLNQNPIELNKDFKGSRGHHIDGKYIINIPLEIHTGKGNYHNQNSGQGMKEMNKKAFKYLYNHQEDMLISIEEAFQINLICVNKWS